MIDKARNPNRIVGLISLVSLALFAAGAARRRIDGVDGCLALIEVRTKTLGRSGFDHDDQLDELLRRADYEMYAAKRKRKSRLLKTPSVVGDDGFVEVTIISVDGR